ncbi:MAG TPA: hypothetical protein VHA56_12885 [Mucilaginibacter sp.]|nr:hypothetical protein [Mucilaginibacter sp.]
MTSLSEFCIAGKQLSEITEAEVLPVLESSIEEMGVENMQVYIRALHDFQRGLRWVLLASVDGRLCSGPDSKHMVRKKLKLFVDHNKEFLDICDQYLSGLEPHGPTQSG